MEKGILFAVHNGMIVSAMPLGNTVMTGGSYTMPQSPGRNTGYAAAWCVLWCRIAGMVVYGHCKGGRRA